MIVTVNGRRFDLRFVSRGIPTELDAYCAEPVDPPGVARIRIRRGLSRDRTRETLIHELLHAARWSMSEQAVTTIAEDIARILKINGY